MGHFWNSFSSVQFSRSVMSDSLQPHGLQHARLPCSSPTPRAYSNSYPLSQWGHPTISSSVIPFSFRLQSFPASESFPMSQFFASDGQRIGISASASVLPMNIQDWFPLRWTGWISLQSKGLSRVFSNTTVQKHQFFGAQLSLWSSSHIHTWLLEKVISNTTKPMRGTSIERWETYHTKEVRNATRALIDTTITNHLYNKHQVSKNTCDITTPRGDGWEIFRKDETKKILLLFCSRKPWIRLF